MGYPPYPDKQVPPSVLQDRRRLCEVQAQQQQAQSRLQQQQGQALAGVRMAQAQAQQQQLARVPSCAAG